jgi:hypothetical protein
MEARQAADVVNDFGRDPIGEGKEEQVRFISSLLWLSCEFKNIYPKLYNRQLKTLFESVRDDVPHTAEIGENKPGDITKKKGRVKLEDLTRYTMVKRIW